MGVANLSNQQQLSLMGTISQMQDPQGKGVYPIVAPYAYGAAPGQPLYKGSYAEPAPKAVAVAPVAKTQAQIDAENKAASDARAATAINAGYDGILGAYDRQIGDIPGQISDANRLVDTQFGAQNGSIESAYGRGNANLQYARDDLGNKTKKSVRDLATGIRQSFDSYSTMIGAGGGGDSSATGQLSYALQKAEAQNRSDIYQSEGDQLAQIGLKQGDLDAQHSDQLNQLNAWKSSQVISIGQQFKQALQQLELAKAGASKDKLVALASLNSNLVNQAVSALSGVQAQHDNAIKAIAASVQGPAIDTSKTAGTNFTAAAPTVAATPALQLGSGGADNGASFVGAVPYYKKLQAA